MEKQRKLKYKETVNQGELVKVKTLAEHEMESGVRRDEKTGGFSLNLKPVPVPPFAPFMKSVQILNFLEHLDKILYKNSRFNIILNNPRGKRLTSKETNLKEKNTIKP